MRTAGIPSSTVDEDIHGRPAVGLIWLVFVFLPLVYWPHFPMRAVYGGIVATAVFVPVYLAFFRARGRRRLLLALTPAAIGFALIPFNPGGNTFVIYAMAMAATELRARNAVWLSLGLVAITAAEFWWAMPSRMYAVGGTGMVLVIGGMVVSSVLFARERALRNAELKLSQDEVRRLAATAERERIGRDLHDLLGHTLSLVALKSELAGKLIERDTAAARAQIREVETVARQALAQVREAVVGMRAAGLHAELAAVRLALLSADVSLESHLPALAIEASTEAALALVLREAVTNVIRHADAQRVEVELRLDSARSELHLLISDDGRGGVERSGTGLTGMRERVEALGGSLQVDSPAGGGTRILVRIPQPPVPAAGAAAATGASA